MKFSRSILIACLLTVSVQSVYAQSPIPGAEAAGRWNITVETPEGDKPSWLEIKTSGIVALVGRYAGPEGSARPISQIKYSEDDETYSFAIPFQWVRSEKDSRFEFTLSDGKLTGWTTGPEGEKMNWSAERAPSLDRNYEPEWGEPVRLLDENLSRWIIPENNRFRMEDGVLINDEAGGNLVTRQKFDDFKLHLEFRYPEGSNSGVYLRGRYEVQISDNYGMKPESHRIGGVYGFIDPSVNAAKKAGEWQSYDITLTGRTVTVELNGTPVIINRPIPGITGGAIDNREDQPGPLMLQGDHGPVEFRNIVITPAVNE